MVGVGSGGRPAPSSAGFVYPLALTSRWMHSRSLSAQTQEMPTSTRQQAEEEERAATAVALEAAQGEAEQAAAAEQAGGLALAVVTGEYAHHPAR